MKKVDTNIDTILENIAVPILLVEPLKNDKNEYNDFLIIYMNDCAIETVGYIAEPGLRYSDFKQKCGSNIAWIKLLIDSNQGNAVSEKSFYSPSLKSWYKVKIKRLENGLILATFIDITIEKKYYKKLKESLLIDSLTGLANRHAFSDELEMTLDTCRYENKKAAVILIDIDNMKNINDSLGIKEGDNIIKIVSQTLLKFSRDNIKIFRYGDDEFIVLISELNSLDGIATITDSIYEAFLFNQLNTSAGIAIFPDDTELKDELMSFSDMALHYAKKNGKNKFMFFEPDMQRRFIQQIQMQTRLASAVIENKFSLFYQPQFDISTGKIRGFEALIRWTDPETGEIPPSDFIPLAEESGLIIPIGNWVLNKAISTLKEMQTSYNFDGIMSINVSPLQLKTDDFLNNLSALIKEYKVPPQSIEIEITEGVMISNMISTVEKLQRIRDMGVKLSLDDFGTGFSSLSYLQKLPLNTLKIDKSFINGITASDGIQANITSSIIEMVSKMGLETIAEGVELNEQLNMLKDFKCTIVQGFLRGKPMPQEACMAYLNGDDSALLKI
ncbi:MAG: bifunctional diguanylate cyclase/phosphodiesterase [Treponema sp.]|nr:bifunctional diguanylate cyclase/phosphodiesterase [Treponema sp.]